MQGENGVIRHRPEEQVQGGLGHVHRLLLPRRLLHGPAPFRLPVLPPFVLRGAAVRECDQFHPDFQHADQAVYRRDQGNQACDLEQDASIAADLERSGDPSRPEARTRHSSADQVLLEARGHFRRACQFSRHHLLLPLRDALNGGADSRGSQRCPFQRSDGLKNLPSVSRSGSHGRVETLDGEARGDFLHAAVLIREPKQMDPCRNEAHPGDPLLRLWLDPHSLLKALCRPDNSRLR